jgi:CelD/BcsL family acetyltransferase involved in cellulose biosynthesis
MNVRTIRSLEELQTVRGSWEHWQTHVNADLAQFELVCRLRPEVESPFVTVLEKTEQPRALLVGRLERTQFAPSIGYLRPFRVPARVIAVIHQGVLGRIDEHDAGELVDGLWTALRRGEADAVSFHHLSEQSPLLDALRRSAHRWLCDSVPRWSTHRAMTLPTQGSVMTTKVSGKHRSRLRRRQKTLEEAFEGRLTWRWLTDFQDIPELCARIDVLAARTYQRGLGAGFFDTEEFRRRLQLFADRKQLRVQLLEIDGQVRAYWFGPVYKGVFHSSETGYDPDLRDFEVGTLMFIRMVDALVAEGVERLDFGLGDAHYKERFGDSEWRETTVWLFAPTAKGLFMVLLHKLSISVDRLARGILERTGLTDRVKALWRRKKATTTVAANAERP